MTKIVDETRKRGSEEVRKSLRNGRGTEKSDEYKEEHKSNGKERATVDGKVVLHLH